MPQTYEILLDEFKFPRALPNSRANFRLVLDVRYVRSNGTFATEHAIMPGLDSYWECDREKKNEPDYVRGADEGASSRVDVGRLDPWDRLVMVLQANSIYGIQVKAFDVNREDVWNRLKEAAGHAVQGVLGIGAKAVGKAHTPVPELASDALGSASDELVSHLLKRLGNGDRILFRGSTEGGEGLREITGFGVDGTYSAKIRIKSLDERAIAERRPRAAARTGNPKRSRRVR
jgi:hypothetical protein